MGREASCTVTHDGRTSDGKALLETDEIIFRGDRRFVIPLNSISEARAEDGRLAVTWPEGTAVFALGAQAARWADAIRNPRTRMDKLGVKPGMTIRILGITEPDFEDELRDRGAEIVQRSRADIIFYQADAPADLARLSTIRESMQGADTLWIASPRGRPEIADTAVMAAGKAVGLVDTKVCRFSDTHTALKFVIPKEKRGSG